MPVLEILGQDGRLLPGNQAGLIVLATMLYPSNTTKREGLVAAGLQDALQRLNPPAAIPPEIAKPVFEQGGEPGITKKALKEFASGLIAGEILLAVLQLVAHGPEHASIRKAQYMTGKVRHGQKYGLHRPTPASPTTIETAWFHFKPVSHLWAAFIPLWIDSEGSEFLLSDEALPSFLSDARWFAKAGTRHHPPGMGQTARPVLDAAEIWAVPSSPEIVTVTLEAPPLSETQRGWLKKYSHR